MVRRAAWDARGPEEPLLRDEDIRSAIGLFRNRPSPTAIYSPADDVPRRPSTPARRRESPVTQYDQYQSAPPPAAYAATSRRARSARLPAAEDQHDGHPRPGLRVRVQPARHRVQRDRPEADQAAARGRPRPGAGRPDPLDHLPRHRHPRRRCCWRPSVAPAVEKAASPRRPSSAAQSTGGRRPGRDEKGVVAACQAIVPAVVNLELGPLRRSRRPRTTRTVMNTPRTTWRPRPRQTTDPTFVDAREDAVRRLPAGRRRRVGGQGPVVPPGRADRRRHTDRQRLRGGRLRPVVRSAQRRQNPRSVPLRDRPGVLSCCGRYWVRTSDLFGVNEALYH